MQVLMLLENNPYPQDARVRSEAETLAANGYAVDVVAPRGHGQPRFERVAGVNVRRFRLLSSRTGKRWEYVLEYVTAAWVMHLHALRGLVCGARVLHLHNPPDIFALAGLAYRLAGRAVIFDHHDLFPETMEAKFSSPRLARVAAGLERATFAVASHVVTTNESYAEVARTRGGKRADQITIVRNGPPDEWLDLPSHPRLGALQAPRLTYLGSIGSQDGVSQLAPLLALLRDRGLNPRLQIIGDGDARLAVEDAFTKYGLRDQLDAVGWVPASRIPLLLADADICLDPAPPSQLNDRSTMIKISEYLALGKPIVAFDLLETRRTCAGAASLVPPGDLHAFANLRTGCVSN
jgi:glycosyltransferase involved in cell wall biosynthesis